MEDGKGWLRSAVVGVCVAAVCGYLFTRPPKLQQEAERAVAAAAALEAKDPAGATRAYETAIDRYRDEKVGKALEPAAAALVRMALSKVETPFTPAQTLAVRAAVSRYDSLPRSLRTDEVTRLMTGRLVAWANASGETPATLMLLDDAARLGESSAARRASELRHNLALKLFWDEPIVSLQLVLESGMEPPPPVFARFKDDADVVLELERPLSWWRGADATVQAARAQRKEQEALLATGDLPALQEAAKKAPKAQMLGVALARAYRLAGDDAAARRTIEGLGATGRLIGPARMLAAELLLDAGDAPAADALLAPWVAWHLPGFRLARHRHRAADEAARASVNRQLAAGTHKAATLDSKWNSLPKQEAQRQFDAWFEDEVAKDPAVEEAQRDIDAGMDLVDASLLLGRIKLERGRAASGDEARQWLAEARDAYLAVRGYATDAVGYHLLLGEAYYRADRVDEAEREFAEALTDADADTKLRVAYFYRQLGRVDRARALSEQAATAFTASDATRSRAASLRARMADSEQDRRDWLVRSNEPDARLNLLEVDARMLQRNGKWEEADAKYAEVAASWKQDSSGSGPNNAALALEQRYRATGDMAHLDEAAVLMAQAVRMWPDDTVVLGNAVSIALYRAHVREVSRWVQPRSLHLSADDADALVTWLSSKTVRERLRGDPDYRRALELLARIESAAPQDPESWSGELKLRRRLGDRAGLTNLAKRVRAVERFSNDSALQSFAKGEPPEVKAGQQAKADQLRAFLVAPPTGTDAKTRAIARILLAYVFWPRPDVAELQRARTDWPDVVGENSIGWSQFASMVSDAAKGDPRREKVLRDLGTYLGARELDLKELRDRPESAEVRKLLADEDPSLELWVVGQLLGDEAMEKKAAATFKDEWDRLVVEIRSRLYQGWPSVDAEAELYGFSQPDRAR